MTEETKGTEYGGDVQNMVPGYLGISLVGKAARDYIIKVLPQRGRMLEIGTYDGVTASIIAGARRDVTVISCDVFQGKSAHHLQCCYVNSRRNTALIVGSSDHLPALCRGASFDLVFVDGDHSFEGCLKDLRTAVKLVKPGGLIMVHDYKTTADKLAGVTRACDEWKAAQEEWVLSETVGSVAVFSRRPRTA